MAEIEQYLQKISDGITTITALDAIEQHQQGKVCFVDLRDGFELQEHGMIPGAYHCPRGSLEFRIPADSPFHRPFFSSFERFVLYCSHGQRSILATDTASKMGLAQVSHVQGGMIAWVEAGGPVMQLSDSKVLDR